MLASAAGDGRRAAARSTHPTRSAGSKIAGYGAGLLVAVIPWSMLRGDLRATTDLFFVIATVVVSGAILSFAPRSFSWGEDVAKPVTMDLKEAVDASMASGDLRAAMP